MQEITRLRALCCECGNLRSVAATYNAPRDDNRTDETSDRDGRGWRCTATLKCSNCGNKTRHALIREDNDEYRDVAELRDYERLFAPELPFACARLVANWFTHSTGQRARVFADTRLTASDLVIEISGIQFVDGSVTDASLAIKSKYHDGAVGSIDAARARQLAAELLGAADVLDELNGSTPGETEDFL